MPEIAYRSLYESGNFEDLLVQAQKESSHRANFWQLIAYLNLDELEKAEKIIVAYHSDFEEVDDPELRQNFINIATQLKPQGKIYNIYEFDRRLKQMYGDFFRDIPPAQIKRGHKAAKIIEFTDYYCRYTEDRGQVAKLRREYNLLQEIQGHLSLQIPNPLVFREQSFEEENGSTSYFAGYFYKAIPGRSAYSNFMPPEKMIELITDLQALSNIPAIKSQLIEFTPQLRVIRKACSVERLQKRTNQLKEEELQKIESFADLCVDYLPTHPKRRTFVHGDLYYGNLIYNEEQDKITALVDFERGWYADPWLDFSKLYYNDGFLDEILKLYKQDIEDIDLNYTTARVLLYRGLFILRRLVRESPTAIYHKVDPWVIQPLEKIRQLLGET